MRNDLAGRRMARLLAWDLGLLAALLAWVVAQAIPSSEAVRLRNALLYQGVVSASVLDWSPAAPPADYLQDGAPPPEPLVSYSGSEALSRVSGNWEKARLIAEHLQARLSDRGPIMAGLEETYRRIVEDGAGYCGDFADVFAALATAAGIPNRRWSFSFDGYGGHGLIFNEVWDDRVGRWRAIDVFNNYLFLDAESGEPLAALEFRAALRGERPAARIVVLNPAARPGYAIPEKAEDYYRRGSAQWYLFWGNNVGTVDASPIVRAAGHLSRHLEQLAAIAVGIHPGIRLVETAGSEESQRALAELGNRLRLAALAAAVLVVVALGLSWRLWSRGAKRDAEAIRQGAAALPRVVVVGPLPPPSGGMANQCRQLFRLLTNEGVPVELVQTNAPYRPAWAGRIPLLRAGFRLLPYLFSLWRAAGRNQVFHIFANSGWAWHLCAAPAIVIAHLRGRSVIVNYRGGQADEFLASRPPFAVSLLRSAEALITPSGFLKDVFSKYHLQASIISNIIDLNRFSPRPWAGEIGAPHCIVTRNLEPIYDIPTAIRAYALVRRRWPAATLTIAGTGPDLASCERLVGELGISEGVSFVGRIDNDNMAALYASADVAINPSTVDNMPISILEAYASGVPVVSTDVGGIPYIAFHEKTALLVPPGQPEAMAVAIGRLIADRPFAQRLVNGGLAEARRYAWSEIRERWLAVYRRVAVPMATVEEGLA